MPPTALPSALPVSTSPTTQRGRLEQMEPDCTTDRGDNARPCTLSPADLAALLDRLHHPSPPTCATRRHREVRRGFVPARPDGVAGAVCGLATTVPLRLRSSRPPAAGGTTWRLEPGDYDAGAATLGFCLGAYRYTQFKPADRAPPAWSYHRTRRRPLHRPAPSAWRATSSTRRQHARPVELADAAIDLGRRFVPKLL